MADLPQGRWLSRGEIVVVIVAVLVAVVPMNAISRSGLLAIALGFGIHLAWRVNRPKWIKKILVASLVLVYLMFVVSFFVGDRKPNPEQLANNDFISAVTIWLRAYSRAVWGAPWRWILVSLIVGFLVSSTIRARRQADVEDKDAQEPPQLTGEELFERINALPAKERGKAYKAVSDKYGINLIPEGFARTGELERELNETNRKYSEVVTTKRIEQAAHTKERDDLKARLATSETESAELRELLSRSEEHLTTLQAKLDRAVTPQVDFNFTAPEEFSTATTWQEAPTAPRRFEIFLAVRSQILISDLRVFTGNNVSLRARGDKEPYKQVFTIKPGEPLVFHVATIPEAGRMTFYTATGETGFPQTDFKITATGSGTVLRTKIGRLTIPRTLASGRFSMPIRLSLTDEKKTGTA